MIGRRDRRRKAGPRALRRGARCCETRLFRRRALHPPPVARVSPRYANASASCSISSLLLSASVSSARARSLAMLRSGLFIFRRSLGVILRVCGCWPGCFCGVKGEGRHWVSSLSVEWSSFYLVAVFFAASFRSLRSFFPPSFACVLFVLLANHPLVHSRPLVPLRAAPALNAARRTAARYGFARWCLGGLSSGECARLRRLLPPPSRLAIAPAPYHGHALASSCEVGIAAPSSRIEPFVYCTHEPTHYPLSLHHRARLRRDSPPLPTLFHLCVFLLPSPSRVKDFNTSRPPEFSKRVHAPLLTTRAHTTPHIAHAHIARLSHDLQRTVHARRIPTNPTVNDYASLDSAQLLLSPALRAPSERPQRATTPPTTPPIRAHPSGSHTARSHPTSSFSQPPLDTHAPTPLCLRRRDIPFLCDRFLLSDQHQYSSPINTIQKYRRLSLNHTITRNAPHNPRQRHNGQAGHDSPATRQTAIPPPRNVKGEGPEEIPRLPSDAKVTPPPRPAIPHAQSTRVPPNYRELDPRPSDHVKGNRAPQLSAAFLLRPPHPPPLAHDREKSAGPSPNQTKARPSPIETADTGTPRTRPSLLARHTLPPPLPTDIQHHFEL
uniref:Uncharacterized protein n=1 Tax=Knipowitschia caucasica TaxID=637954 RepID=A0AAV2JL67_KNICA